MKSILNFCNASSIKSFALIGASSIFITACGGGGGGGDSSPSNNADTTDPVITLNGSATVNVEQGTSYSDASATANDNVDGLVTVSSSGTVDASKSGTYTITYTATDAAGNSATRTRTVTVADTTAPVISLTGESEVSLTVGASFTDEGATATDTVDGDLTSDIVVDNQVDTSVAGTYQVTYNVSDNAGNTATAVVRNVTISAANDAGGDSNSPIVGDWKIAPEAEALGVGPSQGNISWWSNTAADVNTRGCFFDDIFRFNADGTFENVMGDQTWLEAWQGVAADSCGASVTPHDGSNAATYTYDDSAATLTVSGVGAHIGLPKVINGSEIDNPANAAASITYEVIELTGNVMTLDINFGPGYWRYKLVPADGGTGGDSNGGDNGSDNGGSSTPITFGNQVVVIDNGEAGEVWDKGIAAFDQGIGWASCVGNGGADCPNMSWEKATDPDRGDVLQVSHSGDGQLAGLFLEATTPVNLLGAATGNLKLDIKVISGDAKITAKADCVYPCSSGDQNLGERGVGDWETVTIPVSQLTDGGLLLELVSTGIVIWATEYTDTVFQLDNVYWECENSCSGEAVEDSFTPWEKADPSVGYTTPTSYDGYNLVWSDEFDGTEVDTSKWTYDLGDTDVHGNVGFGNNEMQYYRKENATVENGLLVIEAKKESPPFEGKLYTSARLKTQGIFEFKYGRVDIRAAVAEGKGLWSALWMMGDNHTTAGWPYCGEIDIMDTIGGSGQEDMVVNNMYWNNGGLGASYAPASYSKEYRIADGETFSNSFHVFSFEWTEDRMTWYVDDVQTHTAPITTSNLSEAFRNEFFLIFNVAVGGSWPGAPDSTSNFPRGMLVDYVRVFQPTN
jgi:beta-glucanase (GH16 family)